MGRSQRGWRVLGGQRPVQLGLGMEGGQGSPGMPGGQGGLEPRGWGGESAGWPAPRPDGCSDAHVVGWRLGGPLVPPVTPLLRPQSWTQAAEDPGILWKSAFRGRWAAGSGGGERPWCESGKKLTFGAEGRGRGEGRVLPCVPPRTHPRGSRQSGLDSPVPVCVRTRACVCAPACV